MAFGRHKQDPYSTPDDWEQEGNGEHSERSRNLDVRSLFSRLRKAEPEDYQQEYDDQQGYAAPQSYEGEAGYDDGQPYEGQPYDDQPYDDQAYDDPAAYDTRQVYGDETFYPDEPAADGGEWDEEEPETRRRAGKKGGGLLGSLKGLGGKLRRGRPEGEQESDAPTPESLSRRVSYEAPERPRETYETYGDVEEEKPASAINKILCMVVGFLAVLALVAAVYSVTTLLDIQLPALGKKAPAEPEPTPVSALGTVTDPENAQQPAQPADPAVQTGTSAQPQATPEPSGTKAVLTAEGILVPGERGPVVPERDKALHPDQFATATLIGNSFVEGMKLWSEIDKCDYVCADGVSLDNMIGNYLYFVTVRSYDSIYLTLGLNEIGWPVDSFISKYEKVIDYIRSDAYSKDATIYISSVMPTEVTMETTPAESGSVIHLDTIKLFNERLQEMCQRKGCWYLDIYSALADETGYLPADVAAEDHVHFEKTGYKIWTDYLLNHYVDESLLEA